MCRCRRSARVECERRDLDKDQQLLKAHNSIAAEADQCLHIKLTLKSELDDIEPLKVEGDSMETTIMNGTADKRAMMEERQAGRQ